MWQSSNPPNNPFQKRGGASFNHNNGAQNPQAPVFNQSFSAFNQGGGNQGFGNGMSNNSSFGFTPPASTSTFGQQFPASAFAPPPAPSFSGAAANPQPVFGNPAQTDQSAFFGQHQQQQQNQQQPKPIKNAPQQSTGFTSIPSGNMPKKDKKREQAEPKFNKKDKKRENQKENKRDNGPKKSLRVPRDLPKFSPGQFVNRPRPQVDDMAILKPLPKPLTSVDYQRDDWDVNNQDKMAQIEQQYLGGQKSLQSAYDLMSDMHDKERTEMEKRGLVDSTATRKNLTDAIKFVGSCLEMCPVFERVRRAHENNVLPQEKNANGRVTREHAVKAFSRPAAGQPPPLPSDVRPPRVLMSTLQYLVSDIVPKLPNSHAFLWDRTRSIRQDFTYQNYQGNEALWCFEVIARVHCVSLHRMAKSLSQGGEWSQQQELEQFNKCLQSLSEFYQSQPLVSTNEPEIRAYQLLSHFFDEEMAATIDRLPYQISRHPLVTLALELRSLASVSVTKFFCRVRLPDVPATFRAVCEIHYNVLRVRGIRQLIESMHKRMNMYSLTRFVGLLGFETIEEARKFCEHYDLIISYSDEASEEVDVKSWDESNVKDKQALAQAFDVSLDQPIEMLDVLKPLAVSQTSPMPLRAVQPTIQPPRFNPAAPAFKPQSSAPNTQSPQPTPAPSFGQALAADGNAQKIAQLKAQEAELRAQQQAKENQRRHEEENRRNQMLQEQRMQQEKEQQLKVKEEKRKQAELEAQRLRLEQQKRQREQQQQHQMRLQRSEMRASFVEQTKNHIFSKLLKTVCECDSEALIRSINLDNQRVLKHAVKLIKNTAIQSLEKKREQQLRDQELQSFHKSRASKRVISSRSFMDTGNNSDYTHTPSASFEETEKRNGVEFSGVKPNNDDSLTKKLVIEPLDFSALLPLLKKSSSCGLNQLRFVADWSSSEGQWLTQVLQLESYLALGSGTEFKLATSTSENQPDVVVVDQGVRDPTPAKNLISITTKSTSTRSIIQLKSDISKALNDFLSWYEKSLQSHRALSIKRRRVTSPAKKNVVRIGRESLSRTEEPPAKRESSNMSVAIHAQRLRALIAETNKLTNG